MIEKNDEEYHLFVNALAFLIQFFVFAIGLTFICLIWSCGNALCGEYVSVWETLPGGSRIETWQRQSPKCDFKEACLCSLLIFGLFLKIFLILLLISPITILLCLNNTFIKIVVGIELGYNIYNYICLNNVQEREESDDDSSV